MLVLSLAQGSIGEQRMRQERFYKLCRFFFLKLNDGSLKSCRTWTNHLHPINMRVDGIYYDWNIYDMEYIWLRMHMTKKKKGWDVKHRRSEVPMEIFGKLLDGKKKWKQVYIYIYVFIYISFLGGYLVHQISHWQLSAFNVFRSQKQSLVVTNTNTK